MISFIEQFHASCVNQLSEAVYYFRRIFFKLLKHNSGHAVSDFELSASFVYQVKDYPVCGKITFLGYFSDNSLVFLVVKIMPVAPYVKYRVAPKPHWLMHLEIKADAYHFSRL